MSSITFTDNVTPIPASWLNDVNSVTYTLFGNGSSYTGVLTLAGTTDATSTSSGMIINAGGAGIAKALWVGGLANIAGAVTLQAALIGDATTDSTSITSGAFQTDGGLGVAKALWVGGLANIAGAATLQSTLTVTGAITATAGQIVFPATQNASTNANTLDDYEEGTWTPVFTFATAGDLSVSYTTRVATYIKIGQLTNVSFDIVTSAFTHSTASGVAEITGLPFTALTLTGLSFLGTLQFQGITKSGYTQMNSEILSGGSLVVFNASGSAQFGANLSASDFPTGGNVVLKGTISYRAAA